MSASRQNVDVRAFPVGVDTGGTFTDVVLLDPRGERLFVDKVPSTPGDPSQAFIAGLTAALTHAGYKGQAVARVLHGTTVATNLILERKGPPIALIVTSGFRYIVEIGRHDIPKRANLFTWKKPPRPVPPQNIWEIPERVDHRGHVLRPLDEDAVRVAARDIARRGIRAVAVSLLHSYANARHERRIAELIGEEYPEALVTLSSDVLPVFREYERTVTTLLNAYVMPAVSTYVGHLEERALACKISAPILLMKSSGGVTSTRAVRKTPVETALSGPAAGAVGAAFVARTAGLENVITIDIGGTSADIAVIQAGAPRLTTRSVVGDWPLSIPMIDIMTVGAGGGSIARITANGGLTVGPESAGAQPGPVCYRRGGSEPTITDAHVALGHLPPYLLGGKFALDVSASREAIKHHIAKPLGIGIEAAARGMLEVADNNMVGAMRVVSVERGFDPADFALLPFGGAGPLHGSSLARLIGCKTVLVPPAPGVLSALGLLASNLRAEFARTCVQRAGRFDTSLLAAVFEELSEAAAKWFDEEEVPAEARQLLRVASLRYKDQGFELDVPWQGTAVDDASVMRTVEAFHQTHERVYSFAQRDTSVDIVTLRVDAIGTVPAISLPELPAVGRPSDAVIGNQRVEFVGGSMSVPILDRVKLGAGVEVRGPAIFTQLDATTLLLPGQVAEVHRFGSLIIREQ